MPRKAVFQEKLRAVKVILAEVHFPKKYITDQTAICILAMMDTKPGRLGLLNGKATLREGARINNILNFARHDLGKTVAENTRESYRKHSLKPLQEAGIISQHRTSVNDPNTWYELNNTFYAVLIEENEPTRLTLSGQWIADHADLLVRLHKETKASRLCLSTTVLQQAPYEHEPHVQW